MKAPPDHRHVLGLDVIRLWAAASVMFYHLGFWLFASHENIMAQAVDADAVYPYTGWWSRSGWVGVEVFFVLSGAVIARSAKGNTWGRFLRGRLLRLYPAVWVCASLSAVAVILSAEKAGENVLPLYLHSLILSPFGPWMDGCYWTLPIEMSFYLVIAAILSARPERYADAIILTIGVVSASYWLLLQFSLIFAHSGSWIYALAYGLTYSRDWRSLDLSLVHHGCFFALGAMLHRFASGKAAPPSKLAAGFLACGCLIEIALLNGLRASQTGVAMNPLIPQAAWSAAVVLMIASIACNDQIARVCGSAVGGWIRFGGMLTYPLYLCHAPLGFAVVKGLHVASVPSMAAWLGGVAIVTFVAAFVTAAMEPLVRSAASRVVDRLALSAPTSRRRAEAAQL